MSSERAPDLNAAPGLVPMSAANKPTQVDVVGDRIRVASLEIIDRALAGYLESRSPEERPETVERALRVGLMALQSASGSIDVDHVRRAFDKLLSDAADSNKKATVEVEEILRKTFSTEGGVMPATLERFIGDKGQLAQFTKDLFDENRRDSAIGKLNTILGTYFDGDASKLAHLLDPTREASPLSGFRAEIAKRFDDVLLKIVEMEASQKAAKGERKKGTAKGADFESRIIAEYTEMLRATDDVIEGTGGTVGTLPNSKKGDAVIVANAKESSAPTFRIVVEVKDKKMSEPEIERELTEAKANRGAEIALMIFSEEAAPDWATPFELNRFGVFCAVDPEAPDTAILQAGFRLAKISARIRRRTQSSGADIAAVNESVLSIRKRLESISVTKRSLTAINDTTSKVDKELETLRLAIAEDLEKIEEQVRASSAAAKPE
ncbi:MAG: hypothetical protein DWI65_03770 [Candidatus Limnocylindrus sp. ZSMar2m-chloro-G89]|nr:MAG: hypothetical protein DWI65_03770 [Candidatus Limnocylindrus sp. ZSMar2m-chloro-G89]